MINRAPTPGDIVIHPAVLAALLLLILNDRWAKAASPGWVTGKLSDAAGAVVLASVLCALIEVGRRCRGHFAPVSGRTAGIVAASVVALVAAVKTTPTGRSAGAWGAGLARWPLDLVTTGSAAVRPAQMVLDPSDTLVAPVAFLVVVVATRRCRRAVELET